MDSRGRQQAYRDRQHAAGRRRVELWLREWEASDIRRRLAYLRSIGQEHGAKTEAQLEVDSLILARSTAYQITHRGQSLHQAHRELMASIARLGGNWAWARAEVSNELEDFPALRARWDALTN
jgi:hypothetical protein